MPSFGTSSFARADSVAADGMDAGHQACLSLDIPAVTDGLDSRDARRGAGHPAPPRGGVNLRGRGKARPELCSPLPRPDPLASPHTHTLVQDKLQSWYKEFVD